MGKQNINEFLYRNRLKQKDLANYLGISETSVSRYVDGGGVSSKNLEKLLSNPYGWDTSMLVSKSPIIEVKESSDININVNGKQNVEKLSGIEKLKLENEILKEKVDMLKSDIDELKVQLKEEKERTELAKKEKEEYCKIIQTLVNKDK